MQVLAAQLPPGLATEIQTGYRRPVSKNFSIRRVIIGVIVGLAAIVASLPFLGDRIRRNAQELASLRDLAVVVLRARKETERIENSGEVLDSSLASRFRALREAAGEARDCLSELDRAYQWYELLLFSPPTDCKSMLSITTSELHSLRDKPEHAAKPENPSIDGNARFTLPDGKLIEVVEISDEQARQMGLNVGP